MKDEPKLFDPGCQLQILPEGAHPLGGAYRLRLALVRLLQAVERRVRPDLLQPIGAGRGKPADDSVVLEDSREIAVGGWVEVRSYEEILRTLDADNRCRGLGFMPGMERFCGQRFQVLRQVRAMFDERAWRMLKIKDCYLLQDVLCDGRNLYEQTGCDRCCFFFWKRDWLKVVGS